MLLVPVLLYMLACLVSYHPDDPGWSHAGSVTAPIHNFGGITGAYLADIVLSFFGIGAYLLPVMLAGLAWHAMRNRSESREGALTPALRLIGAFALLIGLSALVQLNPPGVAAVLPIGAGGLLGQLVGVFLLRGFGGLGAGLFSLSLILLGITLATGLSWFAVMDRIGRGVFALGGWLGRTNQSLGEQRLARSARSARDETRREETARRARREKVRIDPPPLPVEKSDRAHRETQLPLFAPMSSHEGGLPPLSLLDDPGAQPQGYSEEALETLSRQIEFKLRDFRIEGQVVGVYPGPVITRFEM